MPTWFWSIPTLAAAAMATPDPLGHAGDVPNFRHPVPFAKELVIGISAGRLTLGTEREPHGYPLSESTAWSGSSVGDGSST
jgi:hypothetical protein